MSENRVPGFSRIAAFLVLSLIVVLSAVLGRGWFQPKRLQTGQHGLGRDSRQDASGSKQREEQSTRSEKPPPAIRNRRAVVDDPAADGWETEVFHQLAKQQLGKLANVLERRTAMGAEDVAALVTDDFTTQPLLPATLQTTLSNAFLRLERSAGGPPTSVPGRGASSLIRAVNALTQSEDDVVEVRAEFNAEFKLFRVEPGDGFVTTHQFLTLVGHAPKRTVETHATWMIRWRPGQNGDPPQIHRIGVRDFERATTNQDTGWFADCTDAVLRGNPCYRDQILVGYHQWLQRMPRRFYFSLLGTPGIAVGDVNGDGLDDLYLCQEAGLPNRLFLQQEDGTARDAGAASAVDWLQDTRSALLIDLDNDGDRDLVAAILGGVVVASNDGAGRFGLQSVLATHDDTMSLSAADYDLDGDLDIYVCGYNPNVRLSDRKSPAMPGATDFVLHDANNGGPNVLLRNDGDLQFRDVTAEVGLDVNNRRFSFIGTWDDFDNDDDQDLYVANDYGRDNLYRNDGGYFVDVSETSGAEQAAGGMSAACADYNRDGLMDILVSNMFSAAGNRVTHQARFKPDARTDVRQRLQRFARGNTLLKNLGGGMFGDHSEEAGIVMGRWAWGSLFLDVDNDGWEDAIVSNGYISTEDKQDL